MLDLKDIVKVYDTGGEKVTALNGVSLRFRKNEFVSILGQSGCGKTTLLNIIGGLDKYTSGDLTIAGKSTKQFRDADWDNYRNRSIGFVFQSYNLIPHQTVLSNVELALTLSGVSKHERRKRAAAALEKVGLGDQLKKKPNQMSGGQMQRVAIARALVNDPEILLADEPTGALDSETSVQIMDLLQKVARDRLVIMVTHNPELAKKYSTRIIRLLDGRVVDDSMPYTDEQAMSEKVQPRKKSGRKKLPSMSFFTALALSVNNLLTKKARTVMTAFAGSIGIIGIALIMSVSQGVQTYIDGIERNTMSSYPITVDETTMDTSSMLSSFMGSKSEQREIKDGTVYSNDIVLQMMETMSEGTTSNNLEDFKKFVDSSEAIQQNSCDIKYSYKTGMNVYLDGGNGQYTRGLMNIYELYDAVGLNTGDAASMMGSAAAQSGVWTELVGDSDYIAQSYDVLYGKLPESANEAVLIINDKHEISDYTLYSLGLRDSEQLRTYIEETKKALASGTESEYKLESRDYTYEELCGKKFRVLTNADMYSYNEESGRISESSEAALKTKLDSAPELTIVGIVTAADKDSGKNSEGTVGYTSQFMQTLIEHNNADKAVKAQLDEKNTDLFTGISFETKDYTAAEIRAYVQSDPELSQYAAMPDDMLLQYGKAFMKTQATYQSNLEKLGYVNEDKPSSVSIYPQDFEAKKAITDAIEEYNAAAEEKDKITYTDMVALLMSSVTTIVNAISYVLIAFVAISLIVSSIMIGIITYISVLERTKEIGILRSIGASKRDISHVFNAETTIVGFTAGVIGIGITLLLLIPINIILHSLTGISTLSAILPWGGAVILVIISILLTYIAGLIPSGFAARRDPVEALRTE